MNLPLRLPDQTYEGGLLPVNADRIERRLSEIWSLARNSGTQGQELVKVCLANIVVLCDGLTRPQAELLTIEIAREHPSRVILTVIDEDLKSYYSFVRTSCTRDPDTGLIRCWEIIEIVSETAKIGSVAGALRSLLVDSIPIVTVDFRQYQSTPELDDILMELSELVLVTAEIVPISRHEKPFLPFRWYRTLPIRLLVGDLFSLNGLPQFPSRFTVLSESGVDTFDDLLAGWLIARLGGKGVKKSDHGVSMNVRGHTIEFNLRERQVGGTDLLLVEFGEGKPEASIAESSERESGNYRLTYQDQSLQRSLAEWSLPAYIVGTLVDSQESREYRRVAEVVAQMRGLG